MIKLLSIYEFYVKTTGDRLS